jgi:hypothetical protein
MFGTRKIKLCKKCSGLTASELEGRIDPKDYSFGCIQKCLRKNAGLKGKVFGKIKGEFVVCDTKEEFFAKIANIG